MFIESIRVRSYVLKLKYGGGFAQETDLGHNPRIREMGRAGLVGAVFIWLIRRAGRSL